MVRKLHMYRTPVKVVDYIKIDSLLFLGVSSPQLTPLFFAGIPFSPRRKLIKIVHPVEDYQLSLFRLTDHHLDGVGKTAFAEPARSLDLKEVGF